MFDTIMFDSVDELEHLCRLCSGVCPYQHGQACLQGRTDELPPALICILHSSIELYWMVASLAWPVGRHSNHLHISQFAMRHLPFAPFLCKFHYKRVHNTFIVIEVARTDAIRQLTPGFGLPHQT
jgi:hypothetical protein